MQVTKMGDPNQGAPQQHQLPQPMHMMENEMIGAIKIKDGLFIGDEYASTVSTSVFVSLTLRVCPLWNRTWNL